MKGSGSAMLRWFNTASLSEAKSQLETMHIAFRLPRFLCSREFKRMSVRSQMRRVRRVEDIVGDAAAEGRLLVRSSAQIYLSRDGLSLPPQTYLTESHPSMHLALWQYILLRSDRREAIHGDMPAADVRECWSGFLVGLSWWDFERHFKVVASSHPRRPGGEPSSTFGEGAARCRVGSELSRRASGVLQPWPP